jgi:hypothetical protein
MSSSSEFVHVINWYLNLHIIALKDSVQWFMYIRCDLRIFIILLEKLVSFPT